MTNHATPPRRVRYYAAVIALLLVAMSLGAPTSLAQEDEGRLGEVLWPAEEHRDFQNLSDLGASIFNNTTEPMRLGLTPMQSLQAERENATTSRLVATEEGGRNVSFVQHHEPWDGGNHTSLKVDPSQLLPMVGIRMAADPYAVSVLTLTGPPGSFDLDGRTIEDKTEAFADTIGFPVEETSLDLKPGHFPSFFGLRGCYEEAEGKCQVSADFSIDCPSCTLAKFDAPRESGLDRAGVGLALFDEEDRMIAVTVQYGFDVDESAVLEPATARDQAADALQDRGYEVNPPLPDAEDVTVFGVLSPTRVDVQEMHYQWRFGVSEDSGSGSYGNGTSDVDNSAEVTQNAATGEVISVNVHPTDVEEPAGDGFLGELVPVPGLAALLALVAAGLLRRQRRA
jgi:hypothetical protein